MAEKMRGPIEARMEGLGLDILYPPIGVLVSACLVGLQVCSCRLALYPSSLVVFRGLAPLLVWPLRPLRCNEKSTAL